jgi:hypothetical protein
MTSGDFCQKNYQLACLFARLLCCAKGYIARLCAPLRALQADENPAQSGSFFSSIRLSNAKNGQTQGTAIVLCATFIAKLQLP